MESIEANLQGALSKRQAENRLRMLSPDNQRIDFSSNDYLGLSRSPVLKLQIERELQKHSQYKNGSTGSRLLTGNTSYAERLEQWIADFHHAEAGLIFNSGYDANVGLISCMASRHDTILYDELCHASIIDGLRLSLAASFKFEHNNLTDLEEKLKKARGNIFIIAESVYSMDGDFAPLSELAMLAGKYKVALIVDEAHATGIYGEHGRGKVSEHQIESKVFARVHTFGKALGVHGAIVLGSKTLRSYLINYARPFIFSTTLPFHSLVSIRCAYRAMISADEERKQLNRLTELFGRNQTGPIHSIVIPGNNEVKATARQLQEKGFDVRPIMSPTVPAGKERLRICLHSFNTEVEVQELKLSLDMLKKQRVIEGASI